MKSNRGCRLGFGGEDEAPVSQPRAETSGQEETVQVLKQRWSLPEIVGESPALLSALAIVPKVAAHDIGVLLRGETGTGKEIFARAIHHLSPRCGRPLVALNCGGLPIDLFENELFGHGSGAFTGSQGPAPGLIEQAAGGTLFLDEVDSLPLPGQVKLMRFLQDKEYRPLGAQRPQIANVRIIAASNQDLGQAIATGRLREDLYHRLSVVEIHLPPLRQREGDVLLLADAFLRESSRKFNRAECRLTTEASDKLRQHPWPGNVRELQNVITRAVLLSDSGIIQATDLFSNGATAIPTMSFRAAKASFEADFVTKTLRQYQGNLSKAARAAGLSRWAFQRLSDKFQNANRRRVRSSQDEQECAEIAQGCHKTAKAIDRQ